MSTRLDFRRFARPETLKKIDPTRLRRFLVEVGGGYVPQEIVDSDPLPYDDLTELLGRPGVGYPDGLVDALYHATDFSKDRNAYEALVDEAALAKFPTARDSNGERMTAEDLVVSLWLDEVGQPLVRRVHAQHCTANPRSFESFYPRDDAPDLAPDFGADALKEITRDLDAFFDERRGSRGVRIIPVSKGSSVWLIVRQPAPWERRVYVAEDGSDEMKQGHPEDYDVLIYDPGRRELSIHAKSKAETTKYREVVGSRAFGDKDRFSEAGRMSLEPLRTLGRDALIVDHIDGIHEITLVEIGFEWRNDLHDKMTRRSKDLFATFDRFPMPRGPIRYAVFDVVYRAGEPASAVRVYAGARSSYGRESGHECIKEWLVDRGFLRMRGHVPAAALGGLWRALAEETDTVMPRSEWDALLGEGAGPAAGLLALAGGPSPTHPCGLGASQGCRMVLDATNDDGEATYRCGDQPTRCGGAVLSKGKAAGYRLNLEGLASVLADGVGSEGDPAIVAEPGLRLWSLGTRPVGSNQVSFWFATASEEAVVSAAVTAIRARRPARFSCLLVPSTSALPGRLLDAARGDGVLLLGLATAGSVAGAAISVDLWPLLDAYRADLRDADPTQFCGDRFDLVLDPRGDRFWCFGRPVQFGPREQPARLLLLALARRPGAVVSFEELQAAHPEVIPPTSKPSWPQYKAKLMKAIRRNRRKADPEVAETVIESVAGGAYVLRIAPTRVEWWSAEPAPSTIG